MAFGGSLNSIEVLGTSGDPRFAIRIRGDAERAILRSSKWETRGDRSLRIRISLEVCSVQW